MKHLRILLARVLYRPGSSGTLPAAAKSPVRKLIVMQNSACYRHCLRHLKRLGINPLRTFQSLHAVLCAVHPHADLAELKRHTMVKRVEADRRLKVHVLRRNSVQEELGACASNDRAQVTPWGIQAIRAPEVWNRTKGRGIRVAVLDTGIAGHPDLRVAGRYNAVAGSPLTDQNGHGTHVAGTIAAVDNRFGVVGAAPQVRLYAVKAFGKDGTAYTSDIIQGIQWCIRNRIRVINMSFGMTGESTALRDTIRRAYRRGIVMVASCGNSGPGNRRIDFPARLPETIAVAAAGENGRVADFSSRGAGIDLCAPGVGVCSTYPPRTYQRLDGTSMAAPHVTGAAALLLTRQPGLKPADVKRLLGQSAKPLAGQSTRLQGSGLVQATAAAGK